MHFYSLFPLATAALALPSKREAQWGAPWHHGGGPPHGGGQWPEPGSFAYFLDNDPAGSSIVSLQIAQNGTISQPVAKISTGGIGEHEVNMTGSPMPTDSLGGQGAVTISENMIFTVNAGSNTAALLAIDLSNPSIPRLVGAPANTQGEFPSSITYSSELRKACVLNGGAVAGVTCYSVDPSKGLTIDGPLRQLNSSIINETTPPTGPPGSAAQVLFNPDSSAVFATVKSNSTTGKGSLLVWPVVDGEISTGEPIINQIEGIALDFGFEFLSETTIFLSDPSFGISLLEVASDFTVSEIAHTPIPGQVALCWTEYDPSLKTIYAIDAGANSITTLNPQTGAINGAIQVQTPGTNATDGVYDSAIKNQRMYSLVGTNGIVVVDLVEEKQVQYLDLSSFGDRINYQGMAIWP